MKTTTGNICRRLLVKAEKLGHVSLLCTIGAVLCAALSAGAAFAAAETVTVDNVTDLTIQLDRLNRLNTESGKSRGDVIILKAKAYDVSGCHMLCDNAAKPAYMMSTSHLAIAYVTLKGETDNPRDTVIYGDRSDRILYMFGGKLQNLTISNGCQTVGAAGGAGVCARNEGSSISNVVVTCCSAAQNGGGVYNPYCYDCTIEKCHSAKNGGGIYLSYGFIRGNILDNTSVTGGGGACNTRLNGTYIAGNSTSGNGGGVKWDYGEGTTNCVIVGNTAAKGGGVANATKVYNCIISNNVAIAGGGVIDSTIYRSEIVHNLARALASTDKVRGGGCCKDPDTSSVCHIYDSLVAGNACALELATGDRSGGAGESVHFHNCRIINNFARVGASLNWGSAEDCIISNNVSPLYYHNLRGTTFLKRCVISKMSLTSPGAVSDCVVREYNGNWHLPEGSNVYTNGTFVNTSTSSDTYRLFGNNIGGTFSLTNCLIYGNVAYSILAKDKIGVPVHVVNCTIVDNTNTCMFSGFKTASDATPLYLKNTIICQNKKMSDPSQDCNFWPAYGSANEDNLYIENCLIGPGWKDGQPYQSCTALISSNNPRFCLSSDAAHPYALRANSPVIGKGTVEDWMANAYDIRNVIDGGEYLRLRNGKVDLGCYQCWLDPSGMVMILR